MSRYTVSLIDTQEASLKFVMDRENARISAQNTVILVQWTDLNNWRIDNGLPPLPAPLLISVYASVTYVQHVVSASLTGIIAQRENDVVTSVNTRYASMTLREQSDMLSYMGLSNISPVIR